MDGILQWKYPSQPNKLISHQPAQHLASFRWCGATHSEHYGNCERQKQQDKGVVNNVLLHMLRSAMYAQQPCTVHPIPCIPKDENVPPPYPSPASKLTMHSHRLTHDPH